MIEHAVRYLKQHSASFRLVSHPTTEPLPEVAQRPPPNGQMVDTHVVLVDGAPGLACVPAGEPVDVVSLGQELHGMVLEGSARDLPAPFNEAHCLPPLGGLVGAPVFLDSRLSGAVLAFRAFCKEDFIEVPFDDFARLEKPRVMVIAVAGALPEFATDTGGPVLPATDVLVEGRGAPTPPPTAERASGMPVTIDEERTMLAPPEPPPRRGQKRTAAPAKRKQAAGKTSPARSKTAAARGKSATPRKTAKRIQPSSKRSSVTRPRPR